MSDTLDDAYKDALILKAFIKLREETAKEIIKIMQDCKIYNDYITGTFQYIVDYDHVIKKIKEKYNLEWVWKRLKTTKAQ